MFRKKMIDPLDVRLFGWSKADFLTVRDVLNSLCILGRTGSGKTSSSGKQLARAILSHPKSGGLILSAKQGEDKDMWVDLFKEAGREGDLVVFAPGEDKRLNLLDYVRQMGGDTREITRCIT